MLRFELYKAVSSGFKGSHYISEFAPVEHRTDVLHNLIKYVCTNVTRHILVFKSITSFKSRIFPPQSIEYE